MKEGVPWFTFQFHVYSDYVWINYGDRRVTKVPRDNEHAINAVVDVLEAAGFSPVQVAEYDHVAP